MPLSRLTTVSKKRTGKITQPDPNQENLSILYIYINPSTKTTHQTKKQNSKKRKDL
jgi:hypothetical protein